jgi:hypothetical protein
MPKRRVRRHPVTQPSDQSYRLIALTQGQNAKVDLADFERLNQFNWTAQWNSNIKSFYAVKGATKYSKFITMQAFILECGEGEDGDHKNHDTLDNRRENLRKCRHGQNIHNSKKSKANKSGYRGVNWYSKNKKWIAKITVGYKQVYVGSFDTAEAAARAYDAEAKKLHGEFTSLNFPSVR